MGKSQRIRDERAAAIASNPEKKIKTNKDKKMGRALAITFSVIAVILIIVSVFAILNSTGTLTRMKTVATSENFKVDANMMVYYYSTVYEKLYSYEYQYAVSFGQDPDKINTETLKKTALLKANEDIQSLLAICEAARAAGIELTDKDRATIEEVITSLEAQAQLYTQYNGGYPVSIGDLVGHPDVKADDIRHMKELMALANNYITSVTDEDYDEIIKDDAKLKEFLEENKSIAYRADYLTYTVNTKEEADSLILATTEEEFKAFIITHYVENNYQTQLDKLKLDAKAPVKELSNALKKTIIAELKYSLLDIEVEGVDLKEKTERADRIKAIFEKLYGDKTFTAEKDEKGVTEANEILFKEIATVGTALSSSANSALSSATKTGAIYSLIEETEDKKNDETDEWLFSDERKENEAKYFTSTTTSGTTETTKYKAYFMLKPVYVNDELSYGAGHLLVDVKSSLVTIKDTMTADEKKEAEEKNAKLWADGKTEAEKLLQEFLAGDKTKDSFEKFAEEKTDDSNVFYDDIREGVMVKEFEEWVFDEDRKVGDTGIVKTEYGYHIMYFTANAIPAWKVDVANEYATEQYNDWLDSLDLDEIATVNKNVIYEVLGVEIPADTTTAATTTAPAK